MPGIGKKICKRKNIIITLLCLAVIFSVIKCYGKKVSALPSAESEIPIGAAVLYNGEDSDRSFEDTYSRLRQSLLLNFTVEAVDISKDFSLDGYDVIYPDETIMKSPKAESVKTAICDFTKNGGSVFLTNGFYDFFEADFIGAKRFVKLSGCPANLQIAAAGKNFSELQSIISDFSKMYPSYTDYPRLSKYDYGYAVQPGTAKALVKYEKLALYTMNHYGRGYVFFTNPLLPNKYSINGFSLERRNDKQVSLSNTTASADQLLENAFASFVSKEKYGYSISRVFGSFGRPSMSWELHFEDITGYANNSGILFGELCKKYHQIPSYTIVRNTYRWFLRAESVTYLLNQAKDGSMKYSPDLYEGAYSAGTHIASGGKWLSLFSVKDAGSYFDDHPEYDQRAYPYAADINKDGISDIFSGSADGRFYFYQGQSLTDRFVTGAAQPLKDGDGAEISVGGYSAPVLADLNGDGLSDILSGSSDGNVHWFAGLGDMTYQPRGILVPTNIRGQTLPDVGDLNGDGIPDLLVGSNEGKLFVCYGEKQGDALGFSKNRMKDLSAICSGLGTFLSPRVTDLNGDQVNDLAVGTFDGYIAKFVMKNGGLEPDGYIATDEMNYKGNYNIKFGNNCVPFFADLDGDGSLDLIAGSLEYGLAYPIDSNYFPYREELQKQIDYMRDNYFYAGVHFYTNEYASETREQYELDAHIAAMKSYGLDPVGLGANAHTWYLSSLSPTQTFLNVFRAGLLWDSGFMPPGSSASPEDGAKDIALSLPFFLTAGDKKTILLQNSSVLNAKNAGQAEISAKYDMPMCLYYHCDFTYESEDGAISAIQKASDFQNKHGYNFVTEKQMMQSIAAAYNLDLKLSDSENAVRGKLDITLAPVAMSTDFPLYNKDYQNSCGVKIDFGEAFNLSKIATDADVWYRDGNSLTVSLNRNIRIYETNKKQTEPHIERVNIAAKIQKTESGEAVQFLDGGMMQLVVSGNASTDSNGWDVSRKDGKTIFTKFGKADTLEINY